MKLTSQNLLSRKEGLYFGVLSVLAVIAWLCIVVSVIGALYAIILALFLWCVNGLMVASIRSNSVEASPQQFSDLHRTFQEVAEKLEIKTLPRLYVLQSEGILNAFATRHSGREFVVVFSSLYEGLGAASDEMRFLLGHELGHIKRKHVSKFMFLAPVAWLPLLGAAYRRSVEETCDRYGTFASGSVTASARAMTILAAGEIPGKIAEPVLFAEQYVKERGFFMSWHELLSYYPTTTQRTHHILSAENLEYPEKASRHPLGYIFALLFCRATFLILVIALYGFIIGSAAMKTLNSKIESDKAAKAAPVQEHQDDTEDD